jgi:hypothetical protein
MLVKEGAVASGNFGSGPMLNWIGESENITYQATKSKRITRGANTYLQYRTRLYFGGKVLAI